MTINKISPYTKEQLKEQQAILDSYKWNKQERAILKAEVCKVIDERWAEYEHGFEVYKVSPGRYAVVWNEIWQGDFSDLLRAVTHLSKLEREQEQDREWSRHDG
jgi:hypothetical protein